MEGGRVCSTSSPHSQQASRRARTWSSVQSLGRPPTKTLAQLSSTTVLIIVRWAVATVGSGVSGPSSMAAEAS
jgi:hypothetical protein